MIFRETGGKLAVSLLRKNVAPRTHGLDPGGLHHWSEKLLNGTAGAVTVAGEEGCEVVNKQPKSHKTADHSTAGLKDGMDRHGTQLLSF